MAKQGLLYERPRPVTQSWHADWSVKRGTGYGFARHVSAAPVAVVEFPIAGRDHPIIFVEGEGGMTPLVLLGLVEGENLSVDENNAWTGGYIPAFVRRYPFVLAQDNDTANYTLCIDEASPACNSEGDGMPLFDDKGEPSDYLKQQLELSREWERARAATASFCKRLVDLDLLVQQRVQITNAEGGTSLAGGFSAVDRGKLRDLSDETVGELLRSGHMEAILAHLISLNGLDALGKTLDKRRKQAMQSAEGAATH